jgi:hypothetical protein
MIEQEQWIDVTCVDDPEPRWMRCIGQPPRMLVLYYPHHESTKRRLRPMQDVGWKQSYPQI